MRKNKPQNLNEQLSRMKRLMNFDRINEQRQQSPAKPLFVKDSTNTNEYSYTVDKEGNLIFSYPSSARNLMIFPAPLKEPKKDLFGGERTGGIPEGSVAVSWVGGTDRATTPKPYNNLIDALKFIFNDQLLSRSGGGSDPIPRFVSFIKSFNDDKDIRLTPEKVRNILKDLLMSKPKNFLAISDKTLANIHAVTQNV